MRGGTLERLRKKAIRARALAFRQWTRIPEIRRDMGIAAIVTALNFLLNAALLSIPLTVFTELSYWESVISLWVLIPFVEHYYTWFRERWRDSVRP